MRHRRYYWILLLAILAAAGGCFFAAANWETFRQGFIPQRMPSAEMESEEGAESAPVLKVDGRTMAQTAAWVDGEGNLLISEKALREGFDCAVSVKDGIHILVEWGQRSLEAYTDSDLIRVDGVESILPGSLQEHQGQYYVAAQAFQRAFPYDCNWDQEAGIVVMNNQSPNETKLPSAYDYRENGRSPAVQDQGDLGTCWAFASLTALESSLTPEEYLVFSRDHMSLNHVFDRQQEDGGDYTMAMSYLLSWKGPVLEQQDPYGDGKTDSFLPPVKHVQEIQMLPEKDLEAIKKAVFLYGGVHTPLYFALADEDLTEMDIGQYYRIDTASYCYTGTMQINHDVVIVGWDDQYPKSRFSTEPAGDGAFLCMNSWGEDFGEDGYFWISYYDSNIGIYNICYTGVESAENYDAIYQSDLGGWVGQIGYRDETAYFANVYTAKGEEILEAAGFYAVGPDTSYEIYAVPDFQGIQSLDFTRPVASGTLENAGYYTIPLNEEIALTEGQQFAIIVYIRTPGEERPIAIEYADPGSLLESLDMTDGEGYISLKGTDWQSAEEQQGCNLCLKAYTNRREG